MCAIESVSSHTSMVGYVGAVRRFLRYGTRWGGQRPKGPEREGEKIGWLKRLDRVNEVRITAVLGGKMEGREGFLLVWGADRQIQGLDAADAGATGGAIKGLKRS